MAFNLKCYLYPFLCDNYRNTTIPWKVWLRGTIFFQKTHGTYWLTAVIYTFEKMFSKLF